MANSNRRMNFVHNLLVDGTIYTDRVEISEHIVLFYRNLYIE